MRLDTVVVRLVRMSAPVRRALVLSVLSRVVNFGIGIALLSYGAHLVANLVSDPGSARPLGSLLALIASAAVFKACSRYLEQYSGHWAAFRILAELRTTLYRHVACHPARVASEELTGDLVSRVMADVDRTEVFFAHTIGPACAAALLSIGAVTAAWMIAGGASAAILATGLALVALGWPALTARAGAGDSERTRALGGRMHARILDIVYGIREVLAFNVDTDAHFDEVGSEYERVQRALSRRAGWCDVALDATIAATLVGQLLFGPPAALPALLALTASAFGPALGLANVVSELPTTGSAARRVFELFDRYPMKRSEPDPTAVPDGTGSPAATVRFEDVWFCYSTSSRWVHRGVRWTAPAGSLTVVMGPSGCGKSSAIPLMLGWYTPESGRVVVEPPDSSDRSASAERAAIAVVPQQPVIVRGSVRDNLLIAAPDAPDQALHVALKQSALSDWIQSLPNGLETELGVSGAAMSGGQRRRLTIARALLMGAGVVVFDEPTAHLDRNTASEIIETIRSLPGTRIVFSHDPACATAADHLVRLDGTESVETSPQGGHVWR